MQWVIEARRSTVAADVCWEDVVQPMEVAEARSEASIVPPLIEPYVIPTTAEPSVIIPTSTALLTDAAGGHNRVRVEIVSLCKA